MPWPPLPPISVNLLAPLARLAGTVLLFLGDSSSPRVDLSHDDVDGPAIESFDVDGERVAFGDLARPRTPGRVVLRFSARGSTLRLPHCGGRGRVFVDGAQQNVPAKGTAVIKLDRPDADHEVKVEIDVSKYEKRIACGEPPRAGNAARSTEGLSLVHFASPHAAKGGGEAVVFVPRGHDKAAPGALLVGTHPWNGGIWTYAAYRELLEEAQAKDVVLVMPSGLGNSLYVADAEDEVMRAIDAVKTAVAVDPQRISIWGASMGGAGATTIAFHRPDRFAFVASYFGDSKYDMTTYVKSVLGSDAGAHAVNALDVIENARYLPVFLVHGESDRTSPIVQSTMLESAMKKRGMSVDFERVPGMAHEGPLVVKYIRTVVDRAAAAKAPLHPARVSFRSVRAEDTSAYGVRLVRSGKGDAFVDLEKRSDGIHVLAAEGAREIVLAPGALGASGGDAIVLERGISGVRVRFEP